MPSKKTIALFLLVPFVALTIYSVAQVGYIGLFEYHLHSPAGWQVFTDLVLALIIVFMWLIPDARRSGRNPWPWFAATVFLGSISPLLYLVTAKESDAPTA